MVDNTASMASVGLNNIKTKEVKDDDEIMLQTQGMAAASYAGLASSEETKKTNKEIEEEMKKIDEKYNAKLEEIDHQ